MSANQNWNAADGVRAATRRLEPGNHPATAAIPSAEAQVLCDVARLFYDRGWSVGTSSNYSVVLGRDPLRLLVTASGKDKRQLAADEFVIVGDDGRALNDTHERPSAETLLHVVVAQELGDVGAVLHTHSAWGTVLSEAHYDARGLAIEGYEMLKGLEGVKTHEHRQWVEIFDNTQDIPQLAEQVRLRLRDVNNPLRHGFLIRRHGLYTWGRDLAEARRHVEIFEFLFEVLVRKRMYEGLSSQ